MVDRDARMELASVLAAYMRGEINNFELDDQIFERKPTADRVLEKLRGSIWFIYDDCIPHHIHADRRGWEQLRRAIAFLKSDLERPQIYEIQPKSRVIRQRAEGAIAMLVIIISAYMAWSSTLLYLMLPGLIFGLPKAILMWIFGRRERSAPPRAPFYPFADEAQWKHYESLLTDDRIPVYDESKSNRPIRSQVANGMMIVPSALVTVLVIIPLASVFYLFRKTKTGDAHIVYND
jgi:hypothetical protein